MMDKLKVFKEKYLTQKVRNIISVLVIIFGLAFFINYTFCEPTEVNRMIASSMYKEPANSAFTDENFYYCVVDTYNALGLEDEVAYTSSLTDGQLSMITDISCSGEVITSLSGIEKISSLTSLEITESTLSEIDLSSLSELQYLNINDSTLTSIDVSNNTKLAELNLTSDLITIMDLSKNLDLKTLRIDLDNLATIDLNDSLEELVITGGIISSLDLEKNTNLKILKIQDLNLTEVDLSKNSLLETLELSGLELTSLDVSDMANLKILDVSDNALTEIDLSGNTFLSNLDLSNNDIDSLDVSSNKDLISLNVSSNNIVELDVNENTLLQSVFVDNNLLTEIDLSKNSSLTTLKLDGNKFEQESGIYINNADNVLSSAVKLPDNISVTNKSISNDGTDIEITPDGILASTVGEYDINIKYEYELSGVVNSFEVSTSLYVIEAEISSFDYGDKYIYTIRMPELDAVKNQITTNYGEVEVTNSQVLIKYNEDIVKSFDLVWISSDNYKILSSTERGMHIYSDSEDIDLNNIVCTNCTLEVTEDGNNLIIKYEDKEIDTFIISRLNAKEYQIFEEEYLSIYVGDDSLDEITNNIECINCDMSVTDIDGDPYLFVSFGDVLDGLSYNVMSISSEEYDFVDKYLYYGEADKEDVEDNIKSTNCELSISGDKLIASYNDKEIDSYLLVGAYSENYDLSKDYVYFGVNDYVDIMNNKPIICNNCNVSVSDNKIIIRSDDQNKVILDEFVIVGISSSKYKIGMDTIYVGEDYGNADTILANITSSMGELIWTIHMSGITVTNPLYPDLETDEEETVDSETTYSLVVEYNGEEVFEYNISKESLYLEFPDLEIDETNYIIKKIDIGTTVEDLFSRIDTNAEHSIIGVNNDTVTNESILRTGDTLKVIMSQETLEYAVSVKGDVTGSGKLSFESMKRISKHIIDGEELSENIHILAADYNDDGQIKMNDVMKMAKEFSDNILYGDANLDGKVDNKDLLRMVKYITGKVEMPADAMWTCDLNLDLKRDMNDVKILMRHLKDDEKFKNLPVKNATVSSLFGDCNLDGVINGKDATVLSNYLYGNSTLPDSSDSDDSNWTCDLNLDLSIDETDHDILEDYIKSEGSFELPTLDWASEE